MVPTVAIAMGEVGFFTRVLGAKFKAPFTYASFNPDRVFAPGMPSFQTLKRDYHYDEIDDQTEVYAVIGDPIGQSLSPAIHNAAFRHLGLNKVLVPIRVPAGTLEALARRAGMARDQGIQRHHPAQGGDGRRCSSRRTTRSSAPARATRWSCEDGKRVGYNTDYRAAMDSLEDALGGRPQDEEASPLLDKQVLILGAGGVARSIAFGLMHRGAAVTIASRNDERATKLADEVGCRAIHWGTRAGTMADIADQLHPRRHAPQRRRHARPARGVPGGDARLRHGVPPREHHVPEAGEGARMHDRHGRRHVRPPGGAAVPALHRP